MLHFKLPSDLCCCSDPCRHGARCVGDIDQYVCQCLPGYTGYDCETGFFNEPYT